MEQCHCIGDLLGPSISFRNLSILDACNIVQARKRQYSCSAEIDGFVRKKPVAMFLA